MINSDFRNYVKKYISYHLGNAKVEIKKLFDDYKVKDVGDNIDDVKDISDIKDNIFNVSSNIEEVKNVGENINDVVTYGRVWRDLVDLDITDTKIDDNGHLLIEVKEDTGNYRLDSYGHFIIVFN